MAHRSSPEPWGTRFQLSIWSEPLRDAEVDLEPYVGVLHGWVRDGALGGGVLIDVASYAHVPDGPGVLLIGHEMDLGVRVQSGRLQLTCRHKRDPAGEGDTLGRCLRQLVSAAELLQAETALGEPPRFAPTEVLFRSNDRLLCPNDGATGERLESSLGQRFGRLFDTDTLELANLSGPRTALTLCIKRPSRLGAGDDLSTLRRRLGKSRKLLVRQPSL